MLVSKTRQYRPRIVTFPIRQISLVIISDQVGPCPHMLIKPLTSLLPGDTICQVCFAKPPSTSARIHQSSVIRKPPTALSFWDGVPGFDAPPFLCYGLTTEVVARWLWNSSPESHHLASFLLKLYRSRFSTIPGPFTWAVLGRCESVGQRRCCITS